jgi:hypothetical protein
MFFFNTVDGRVKSLSPSPLVEMQLTTFLKSSCTSPDNSSIETTACTTKQIDQL